MNDSVPPSSALVPEKLPEIEKQTNQYCAISLEVK